MVVWLFLVAAGYRAGVNRIERVVWGLEMKYSLTQRSLFGAGNRSAATGPGVATAQRNWTSIHGVSRVPWLLN